MNIINLTDFIFIQKTFLHSQVQNLGSNVNNFAEAVQENVNEQVKNKLDFGWTWFGKPFSNINKLLGDTVTNIAENAPTVEEIADNVDSQVNYKYLQGFPQKNWTLGFLPFMVFPVTCGHSRGHLNIIGGSFSIIKSCKVILKLFHLFLPNFDP